MVRRADKDRELEQLLALYLEAGADEAIGGEALNQYIRKDNAQPKYAQPGYLEAAPAEPPAQAAPPFGAPPARVAAASAPPPLPPGHAARGAQAIAAAAPDLSALRAALGAFEGCALKHTATNLVFADGNPLAPLMIVGEAPGADEDSHGVPFVGAAGKLLDRMLAAIDLDRRSVYITNILPWRPPGNRTPTPHEVAVCLPFLRRHIELVAPKLLVLVGGTAAGTLLTTSEGITRIRGRWHTYRGDLETPSRPIPALPIYDSAFLLRTPARKRDAWQDMQEVRRRLKADGQR